MSDRQSPGVPTKRRRLQERFARSKRLGRTLSIAHDMSAFVRSLWRGRMRRTEALQGVRMISFRSVLDGHEGAISIRSR
jgi:hypothetical protein